MCQVSPLPSRVFTTSRHDDNGDDDGQVDFAGGRSGHRAKQQQGTEQIAKAAALPKRRRAINIEDKLGTDTSVASVSRSPPASLPERGQKAEKERIGAGEEAGIFAQPGDREEPPLLWDLTAGLGTDAFVLALAGWRVKMFERSPVVAALVQVRRWAVQVFYSRSRLV